MTNKKYLTPQEWLAIFPAIQSEYILPKIRELESAITALESTASMNLSLSQSINDGWFIREIVKAFDINQLISLKQKLNRLRSYLPQQKSDNYVTRDHIACAKEYPIIQLAEANLRNIKKCGRVYRTLCPYHDERTPSFFLFPDTNSFHCFGCQEHGDVIALTQKLMCLNFVDAVKYLTPTYEN